MHRNAGQFGVIHSGTAQLRGGQIEAERFDQMQFCPGICAKADSIACIGRDLRGDENNMEHVRMPPKSASFCKIR